MLSGINCLPGAQNEKRKEKEEVPLPIGAFPTGEENIAFAHYFTGKSGLPGLTVDENPNVPAADVTFEPGDRNNWHSCTGRHLRIAVGGEGYNQERGKGARLLQPGEVAGIVTDVVHGHGGVPDSLFSHLAVECSPLTNRNIRLESVDDRLYAEATGRSPQRRPDSET